MLLTPKQMLRHFYLNAENGGLQTKELHDFDPRTRAKIEEILPSSANDLPFLVYFSDETRWTLYFPTTVMLRMGDSVSEFQLEDMRKAVPASELSDLGDAPILDVTLEDGRIVSVPVEPGDPALGVWRIIGFTYPPRNQARLDGGK